MIEKKGAIPSEVVENGVSEEKEVEELARAMCPYSKGSLCRECSDACFYKDYAKKAIDKGWRKQSKGEWHWIADDSPMCNICGNVFDTNDDADAGLWKFCPNCGAKMKGGAE